MIALFKSIFLRNRSLSRLFCTIKKAKLGRIICVWLTINLVETNFVVRKIITIWVTCVQKNSEIQTLIKQVFSISIFEEIAPNFTYLQKNNLIFNQFLDQLLLPYKFYGSNMNTLFQFCQLWAVKRKRFIMFLSKQKSFLVAISRLP